MEIGDARPEEWPELERIYRETRVARFLWLRPERIAASTLSHDAEGEVVHVAREKGCVLGFVSVWTQDAFVHHLYVDLARHGRGVGSALLDFAASRHPGPLRLKCVEVNCAAREFYQRRGWRVIGRGCSEDGDYLLMESPPKA
jgi:GNAT superfamily N-acetyltransferase